ncbi:MAG: DUF2079 domain-containing protein [Nitrospinota bacterium]|nr:DUF2079 domain-containing protein [Nitrospinota bacterium]
MTDQRDSEDYAEGPMPEPINEEAPTTSLWSRIFLALLVVGYISWFTYHSIDRWSAMRTSLDFVHLDSAAYNTAHGKFMFSNAKMINFWAEHISPTLLVVSFFHLFSDGYWFIFFYQSASIGLAAIPLFLLARKLLGDERAALFFAMGYLANGMIQMANLFEYHEYAHTGLFFFGALLAASYGRWGWYALCAVGIMAVKEDGFVTLAGVGLYAAVACKAYRKAAFTWIACAVVATLEFGVIYPWLRGGEVYKYDSYYSWIGTTLADKLAYVLGSPVQFISQALSSPARAAAWWNLLLGFIFLPLFSPLGAAIMFWPSMELFLSWYPGAHGLNYHYPLLVMPMWTAAAVMGTANLARFAAKLRPGSGTKLIVSLSAAIYILGVNLWQAGYYGGLPIISNPSRLISEQDRAHARIVREALKIIPPGATISAHDGPYSFLTHTPNAYLYHGDKTGHVIVDFYGGKKSHGYDLWPFTAMDIEYIVLDSNAPLKHRQAHKWDVEDVKGLPDYEMILERDGLYIFKLRKAGKSRSPSAS